MKSILYNIGYFLKEAGTIIRLNLFSNIFSLISTGLIFFILAMVISGWWVSSQIVSTIQQEAEINVYYEDSLEKTGLTQLEEKIKAIAGVREVRLINEAEAYNRMVEILGKEARVLEHFDDNPFSPFIEVKIHIEKMNSVLEELEYITDISHIRDNREVLERLQSLAAVLQLLGYLVIAAVAISTLVIIGHIIRLGIYNNREQINTLRLLGASESFISFPFLLEGLVLTLGGGILASALAAFALKFAYAQMAGPLPFIPLPPQQALIAGIITLTMSLSGALGILGSLFGLSSAKSN